MPWFCHTTSKKRSNKTRVGAAGRKSRRKEIERRPTFVVVVKNFTASLRDELSVHRGQVVEVVCTKGNLVYVRDMNSSVGYVPNDHTLDIERIEGTFSNVNIVNGESTILSGDNITGPAPHPRLIDVSTLQRSGSSVNSVEVHQVSDVAVTEVRGAEEGKATPTSSLSSQVIYEVPRYPDGMAAGTTISKEDGGKAPALPPRSSCLPSLAEIQQGCTHSYDQNGHHHPHCLQQCRPCNLSLSSPSSANSYRTNCPCHSTPPRSRYPYGPFPPVSSDPASCKCHTASTPLNIHPYKPGFPPCTPGCSPPAWTPGTTPNGILPCGKKPISQAFSANVPGSALSMGSPGLPTSYTSANFASNPGTSDGSRDLTNQKVGYGFIIPSSSSPTSSVPPYRQRPKVRAQRNRRYSSDVQVQTTISENISNEAKIGHGGDPLGTSRQNSRRRSQPCLVTDRTSTPGHQPQRHLFQLPVRRSLSLCGPSCVHAPTGQSLGQSSCPCTPLQKKQPQPISIHRAPSYKEAVLSEDETDIKPSEIDGNSIPCHPLESGPSTSVSRRPRSGSNLIDENVTEISMCAPDDVLPLDMKKPVGIYRCLRMHKPKFKGEIALRKNEMVIVLDYGKGEWAWVMTSANLEGVVPKSVLVKYHPNGNGIRYSDSNGEHLAVSVSNSSKGTTTKGNGTESVLQAGNGIDAATQTEASHLSYHGSSRSASVGLSMGYSSSSSVPTNESSPLSTSLRAAISERRGQISKKEVKAGIVLLEAAATAIVEHVKVQKKTHPHTTKEWFNTMDSLDEKDRIAPLGSHTSLILRQVDSCSPSQLETVTAAESSRSSKEEAKVRTFAPATSETAMTTEKVAAATGGTTTAEVVKPGTIHYHDRISSLGSVSFNNKIAASLLPVARSAKQRSRQLGLSNVLTVIKNYSPPPTAKNCLTIKEGDILHLQMHMHYPKGWLWVWHTTRRSFGYIPKSYIAYTYNTTKRQTPRNNTQEDAV